MAAHSGGVVGIVVEPDFAKGTVLRSSASSLEFTTTIDLTEDTSPPTLEVVSPAVGTVVAASEGIVIKIEDNRDYVVKEVWARFSSVNSFELVYENNAFTAEYGASFVDTVIGPIGDGYFDRRTFNIYRNGGWPADSKTIVRLRFTVVDSSGNILVLA